MGKQRQPIAGNKPKSLKLQIAEQKLQRLRYVESGLKASEFSHRLFAQGTYRTFANRLSKAVATPRQISSQEPTDEQQAALGQVPQTAKPAFRMQPIAEEPETSPESGANPGATASQPPPQLGEGQQLPLTPLARMFAKQAGRADELPHTPPGATLSDGSPSHNVRPEAHQEDAQKTPDSGWPFSWSMQHV